MNLLELQRRQQIADLKRIRQALTSAAVGEFATEAVRDRFERLVREADEELEQAGSWQAFEAARKGTVTKVRTEALAFVQAALFALADAESTDHTAGIIRVPFPDSSVWRLPVVVHEFGHHVVNVFVDLRPTARAVKPLLAWPRKCANTADEERRYGELLADAYACYVLGWAYPVSSILLQARPDQAFNADSATHPSWCRRIATMLAFLRAQGGASEVAGESRVAPLWRAALQPAGDAGDDRRLDVIDQAEQLLALMRKHLPDDALYVHSAHEDDLVGMLARHAPDPPEDVDVTQILAAAWLWRLNHLTASTAALATVSSTALQWCLRSGQRASRTGGSDER